jgi:HK97 gp10 family phage protein
MAAKPKMRLESRFPAVKKAAYEVVQHARDEALIEGVEETRRRIEKGAASRGYDLDPFVVEKENIGHQSGRIFVPSEKWFYRFFEFGSVYIAPIPFIRPAHRRMRKTFVDEMGDQFEKFVRRRVRRV